MKKLILILFFSVNCLLAQQNQYLVKWDEYYWNTQMIQNKYPEWPKISTIQIDLLNNNTVKISSLATDYVKVFVLRQNQDFNLLLSNPNLLKPILFGMRVDNSMVNIYSLNAFSYRQLSPRIKGSLDPNRNYLSNTLKY